MSYPPPPADIRPAGGGAHRPRRVPVRARGHGQSREALRRDRVLFRGGACIGSAGPKHAVYFKLYFELAFSSATALPSWATEQSDSAWCIGLLDPAVHSDPQVALKFLDAGRKDALRHYLLFKLKAVRPEVCVSLATRPVLSAACRVLRAGQRWGLRIAHLSPHHVQTAAVCSAVCAVVCTAVCTAVCAAWGRVVVQEAHQRTMLCTWLTEMFLERLGEVSCTADIASIDVEAYHAAATEFEQFLVANKVRE
jgi:hypothetical protein